jgi:hypothetical protein
MLVEMKNRGIRPDAILFADTGAERPATYINVERVNAWTRRVGFPEVTTVRYIPPISPYENLEGECLTNEALPGLAFGRKHCSAKWKVEPQERWLRSQGIRDRRHAIGLDDGPADRRRADTYAGAARKLPGVRFWYPLQDWNIDRDRCKDIIKAEGLPEPIKSCCFFCPGMKPAEIREQARTNPDLHSRALLIEDNWIEGKHCVGGVRTTKGLGRSYRWRDVEGDPPEESPRGVDNSAHV